MSKVIPREELYKAEAILRYAIRGLETELPMVETLMKYGGSPDLVKSVIDFLKTQLNEIKSAYDLIKKWMPT
jgi:hypothetical protein